ncbi:MAG: tetratricopeptide repeat protein, partial [Meiothermus sp.]|nr:tetratricopeptide repeat protein [Meiothermus sp.]
RGGFERSAALAVSGASNLVLLELLDSSLIRRIQGHTNRFDLHELVRQYAQEKLEADPAGAAAARRKHAEWFLSWAKGIQLRKQKGLELVQWMRRIEQELDNLRAVLVWAEREDEPQTIIHLGSALLFFWRSRGYAREGLGWISRTLDRLGSLNSTQLHASALTQIGDLYVHEGDMKAAGAAYQKAVEVAQAADHPEALAQALNGLGIVALYDHDYPLSRQYFSELSTLTRQLGDKTLAAMALNNLGCVLEYEGNYQGALDTHSESLNLKIEIGDAFGQSISLRNMGLMARLLGDYATAHRYLEQSLEISTALDDRQVMLDALNASSALAFQQADYNRARSLYHQSLRLSQTVQYRGLIAYMLEGVAALLGVNGQGKTAARLLGQADALRHAAKIPVSPSELAAYQTQLENIKAATGELGFSLAWREGQALSLEQALALALEALDTVSF